jgi:hypothetical protein
MDPIIEMLAQVGCEEVYHEDEEPEGRPAPPPVSDCDEEDVPF